MVAALGDPRTATADAVAAPADAVAASYAVATTFAATAFYAVAALILRWPVLVAAPVGNGPC